METDAYDDSNNEERIKETNSIDTENEFENETIENLTKIDKIEQRKDHLVNVYYIGKVDDEGVVQVVKREEKGKEETLEDVLSDFKLSGSYHLRFFLLIFLLGAMSAQQGVNYIFTAENTNYMCKYTNCSLTEVSRWTQNSTLDMKCRKYDTFNHNGPCTEENFDSSNFTYCNEWIFENPHTFVEEFHLECEEWKRTLVGTMHSIGYMLGLLITGPMSDKYGRKIMIIFSVLASGLIGVTKSMMTSYWIFVALELLEPMLGDCYAIIFTWGVETVTKRHRSILMFILTICATAGQILMAVAAYVTPNWRIYLVVIYTPAIFVILNSFWMDESLRWLLIKGKKTEVLQIVKKAAKINNIVIEDSRIMNLSYNADALNESLWTSVKITLASRKLFSRLLICFCVWFTSVFNSYSLLINSTSLEGDKYINYGLVALAGIIASVILFYVVKKFKRKWPLIFTLVLTGVFCVAQSFVPKEYRWLSIFLYVGGKINSSIVLRMAFLFTSELFPTSNRNTMLSLCSSFGRVAGIIAPQTPLLLKYGFGVPSLVVGVLSLMTAFVVLFMPDTSEDILPDNVKEAEAVGNKQKNDVNKL